MFLVLLPLLLVAQAATPWDAPALHFEVTDITTESRKQLKTRLEEHYKEVKNFRADTSIGKDGVIVTKIGRLSSVEPNDIIKKIDGSTIAVATDIGAVLKTLEPGVFVKIELLRPTPKGNRANYTKMEVDYAPTSEYLLALGPFDKKEIKASKQVLYAPIEAERRRAIYLQLLVGPGDRYTQQIVFNFRRSYAGDQLDNISLITDSKTIRITSLYYNEDPQFEKKMKTQGEITREWVELDAAKLKDLLPVINGREKITLQLSTETEVKFDEDVSESLRENKKAVDKLIEALKSRAK